MTEQIKKEEIGRCLEERKERGVRRERGSERERERGSVVRESGSERERERERKCGKEK